MAKFIIAKPSNFMSLYNTSEKIAYAAPVADAVFFSNAILNFVLFYAGLKKLFAALSARTVVESWDFAKP